MAFHERRISAGASLRGRVKALRKLLCWSHNNEVCALRPFKYAPVVALFNDPGQFSTVFFRQFQTSDTHHPNFNKI